MRLPRFLRNPDRLGPFALLPLVILLLPTTLPAQEDYELREDMVIEVDGESDPAAEVYFSRRFPSYLILSPAVGTPILIEPRSQMVREVHVVKIAKQPDGTIDLLEGAQLEPLGAIRTVGTSVAFDVAGHSVVLKDKPPLLGALTLSKMLGSSASYQALADAYTPDPATLEKLRSADEQIRVRVYFGSWCPFCQRYVPRIMKVGRELEGSSLALDFYGLPQTGFGADPEAKRLTIKAVPTAVVWVDGKEVGRIQSEEWQTPEKALLELID